MKRIIPSLAALLLAAAGGQVCAQQAAVEAAWVRPTPPGAQVGGAFLTLVGGRVADRVVAASSPAAAAVEMHTHVVEGGVAKMRALPAIDVPAGSRVELKPGGLHLMLVRLKAPLAIGGAVPLKLRFEKAGEVEVRAVVAAQAPGAPAADQGGHAAHEHPAAPHRH